MSSPLSLRETTPITEAIENGVEEGVRALNDISSHLQRAISLATTDGPVDEYLIQSNRLALSVLRGMASAWSTAANGLGLIVAGEVEWWWTDQVRIEFADPAGVQGVALASATALPELRPVDSRWVRVVGPDGVQFLDRSPGVGTNWDGSCYVAVRQHDDFIAGAVRIEIDLIGPSGEVLKASHPLDTKLSLR